MKQQEHNIISLVLNEMAFEGAIKHFQEVPPDLPRELFEELKGIGIPGRYDVSIEDYRYVAIEFDHEKSVFENCTDSLERSGTISSTPTRPIDQIHLSA